MINISPRQMDVFVQIALLGSVRAAAERLHLTQPAASMALAEMERQLDGPVFDRERGRLHLNARGRELLPLAQELLERHAEFGRRGREDGA
jgi:DNA-binding transcriptional LysR family regulator